MKIIQQQECYNHYSVSIYENHRRSCKNCIKRENVIDLDYYANSCLDYKEVKMEKKYTEEDMKEYAKWAVGQLLSDSSLEKWEQSKIKNEVWKPKEKNNYFVLDMRFKPFETSYDFKGDLQYINNYNCFETKEKAVKVPMRLFMGMWSWKLSNDDVFDKYCPYSIDIYTMAVNYHPSHDNHIIPYFYTTDKAHACLEWLKKEGLI